MNSNSLSVLESVVRDRPRELTRAECSMEYKRTGQGIDSYRNVRPYVQRFMDTLPEWSGKSSDNNDAVLFHAWLVSPFSRMRTIQELQDSVKRWYELRDKKRYVTPSLPTGLKQKKTKKAETPAPKQAKKPPQVIILPATPAFIADDTLRCRECEEILVYEGGRPPIYCSGSCKMKAYRRRKKQKSVTKRGGAA